MNKSVVKITSGLRGQLEIPADKSISHRAVMFSSLAKGKSIIKNFSQGQDPLSSLKVFQAMGVDTRFIDNRTLEIVSSGELMPPAMTLNCGNSGTTMRLVSGILAGQNFNSVLIGDESLSKRPMKRIIGPLELMGAKIKAIDNHAPLSIFGTRLHGIDYVSKLASAQVKSCILLAGLYAEGKTSVIEPYISRDHTERMLKYMGADIDVTGKTVTIRQSELKPQIIEICGDISSAAYFIAAALVVPKSKIILKNLGLNPTRTGIIDVVQSMGGNIKILAQRQVAGEEQGDIEVEYSELKGCNICGELIPRLIDELPVIAVLATQAEGDTIVKDAKDLRNKESDRISTIVNELKKIGADIEELEDGFVIHGKTKLTGGAEIETYHDHRLAMSMYVAGLVCEKQILIKDFDWVNISFPEFCKCFEKLMD